MIAPQSSDLCRFVDSHQFKDFVSTAVKCNCGRSLSLLLSSFVNSARLFFVLVSKFGLASGGVGPYIADRTP